MNFYTPQRYDKNDKPYKTRKPFKKKCYLKRSKSRKPYLSKHCHIRKFDWNREYKNKLSCFTCGSTDHLVKDRTKRKNYHNKKAILIDCVNEVLLHVDEYVSDTKSIYSIISYQDTNEIEEIDSDTESTEFIDNILDDLENIRTNK